MTTLLQSLQEQDLGQLHIIAELWGIELDAPDVRQARKALSKSLLNKNLIADVYPALPGEAQAALQALRSAGGRLRWEDFSRQFGSIREMGAGRRDREKPYLKPVSTAETLWYRAWIGRAFFETPNGPQEFVYLPEDLLSFIPQPAPRVNLPFSRPATKAERAFAIPAIDAILDHSCTYLAALRMGWREETIAEIAADWPAPLGFLNALLMAAGVLNEHQEVQTEAARKLLEASRGKALAQLARAWLNSAQLNDLRMLPTLKAEGSWQNDPLAARVAVLGLLGTLEHGTWWSLPVFISEVHTRHPDFQRSAGAYDAWYLKDNRNGEYRRGVGHWDAVEGELLRYMVTGPLHWLGIVDLAAAEEDGPVVSFRFTKWAKALLAGKEPAGLAKEEANIHVSARNVIEMPPYTPRTARYLIARFCEWQGQVKSGHRYQITPAALENAKEQGLQTRQLLSLLEKHSNVALPPNLEKALARWEEFGTQARLETVSVLRVTHPDILQQLRGSRAARFLGDPLGPTSVIVKSGARQQVLDALAELSVLGQIEEADLR